MPAQPTRGTALYRIPGGVVVRVPSASGTPVLRAVLSNGRDPIPVGATVEFTWDASAGRHVTLATYLS